MLYNKCDERDIERFGKLLENKSLREFGVSSVTNSKDKGNMNKLVEEYYFGIKNNNEQEPDFKEVGVELKVTPLKKLKSIPKASSSKMKTKGLSAKERTVLTIIDYFKLGNETWDTNTLKEKAFRILFCFYLYEEKKERLDFIFDLVNLWSPSPKDIEIIKDDWQKIQKKVLDGKAHEISEGDTLYLGACTKGKDNTSLRNQPFSNIKAKQRAFSFKRSYMEKIYEQLLEKRENNLISIKIGNKTLENTLEEFFSPYKEKTIEELCSLLTININLEAKNLYSHITNKILKVKSYKEIEEFQKAGISIKSIRIDREKKPLESISFPKFKILELVKEEIWEESELYQQLEKKFLFITYSITTKNKYQFNKLSRDEKLKHLKLSGIKLWSISDEDLDKMKELWIKTKTIFKQGVIFKDTPRGKTNNLPKSDFNKIGHVRPHCLNAKDTDTLPNGDTIPKQCFWLNDTFIQKELLKD